MTQLEHSMHIAADKRETPVPTGGTAPKGGETQPVNLTIKVHKRQRLHWLIEAKKQGTSLTAAITEALNERFGVPD